MSLRYVIEICQGVETTPFAPAEPSLANSDF